MYTRKRGKIWQCQVYHNGKRISSSFSTKAEALKWGKGIEVKKK